MIDPDEVLMFSGLFGMLVFFTGIVIGNTVLFRMQRRLNEQLEPEKKVSPWKVMGKGGGKYETFESYRKKFGINSLVHLDRISAWLIGGGLVVGLGSFLILKARS